MPPKENEVELSELYALEEQVEDLKYALYDARKQLKNAIIIPKGATNGDMIMTMFPNVVNSNLDLVTAFNNAKAWWNAPFKKDGEE